MLNPTRFPLAWPLGWPRTANVDLRPARFTQEGTSTSAYGSRVVKRPIGISSAVVRLEYELARMAVADAMISSNLKLGVSGAILVGQGEPADRGIAVYFTLHSQPRVLACDRYLSAAGNIAAVAAHVAALRAIERYGVGTVDQAFAGYAALPAPGSDNRPSWRADLGFQPTTHVTADDVRVNYRHKAKMWAADEEMLKRLNLARDAALTELGDAR